MLPRLSRQKGLTAAALGTSVAAIACVSTCPEKIESGASCSSDGKKCQEKDGCGGNGYRCENGKWRDREDYRLVLRQQEKLVFELDGEPGPIGRLEGHGGQDNVG